MEEGDEGRFEGGAVMVPASGVGQGEVGASPIGLFKGALYVGGYGTNHGDYDFWLKLVGGFTETGLPCGAGFFAERSGEPIDRPGGEVNEVATQARERCEKVRGGQGREGCDESFTDGAVQAGVCMIEEPAGGRRRFTDEEQADFYRNIALVHRFTGDCGFAGDSHCWAYCLQFTNWTVSPG